MRHRRGTGGQDSALPWATASPRAPRSPATSLGLQAHRFEGMVMFDVKLNARDSSVADRPNVGAGELDLLQAVFQPTKIVKEQQDPIPSEIDGLIDLTPIGHPWSHPVQPRSPQAIQTGIGFHLVGNASDDALKVRVHKGC